MCCSARPVKASKRLTDPFPAARPRRRRRVFHKAAILAEGPVVHGRLDLHPARAGVRVRLRRARSADAVPRQHRPSHRTGAASLAEPYRWVGRPHDPGRADWRAWVAVVCHGLPAIDRNCGCASTVARSYRTIRRSQSPPPQRSLPSSRRAAFHRFPQMASRRAVRCLYALLPVRERIIDEAGPTAECGLLGTATLLLAVLRSPCYTLSSPLFCDWPDYRRAFLTRRCHGAKGEKNMLTSQRWPLRISSLAARCSAHNRGSLAGRSGLIHLRAAVTRTRERRGELSGRYYTAARARRCTGDRRRLACDCTCSAWTSRVLRASDAPSRHPPLSSADLPPAKREPAEACPSRQRLPQATFALRRARARPAGLPL